LRDAPRLNGALHSEEAAAACDTVEQKHAVAYARIFATSDGRGRRDTDAYARLEAQYGAGRARSVRALCWLLYWGSFTGNTLNGAIGYKTPKPGTRPLFQSHFIAYYGVLFWGVVTAAVMLLKLLPPLPAGVVALIGTAITVLVGAFFVPLGIVGWLIEA